MSTIINKIMVFTALLALPGLSQAQQIPAQYIAEALKNNDGIKEQQFQLSKAMAALQEARTMFLPQVALVGNYTLAQGGRTFDIPVGNMLNPVYATLNELTHTNNFPMLQNQSILMNPDNFYDAHFHTTMPLIDAEVYYNRRIKQQAITLQQASVNVYKRELVKDVKEAYYRYCQAVQAVAIYNSAAQLVDKNIAVNESLYHNGVRNRTALERSATEREQTAAQVAEAENNARNARAYFNFLLNRPLDGAIDYDSAVAAPPVPEQQVAAGSVTNREELQQLMTKEGLYDLQQKMEHAYIIPKLGTFIDLGSQGFNFEFDGQTRYYFFGLNLEWDLFAWGKHNYRVQQAQLDLNTAQQQYDETEKAYTLQVVQARNNFSTAVSSYHSALAQEKLAEKYYSDQQKAYKAGELLYIELLDAQNELTTAKLKVSMGYAGLQIAAAETERNTAAYPLNN